MRSLGRRLTYFHRLLRSYKRWSRCGASAAVAFQRAREDCSGSG